MLKKSQKSQQKRDGSTFAIIAYNAENMGKNGSRAAS